MQNDPQPENNADLSHQVEELRAQMSINRGDIDDLQVQSGRASDRADAAKKQADHDRQRIEDLEQYVDLEGELLSLLRADGVLKDKEVAHLKEALGTSRRIGAALGIIMAAYKVSEVGAFEILRTESQNTNKKVRALADDVVQTGDVSRFAPPN